MDRTIAAQIAAAWYRQTHNTSAAINAEAAPHANSDGSRQVVVRSAHGTATLKVYPDGQVILLANHARPPR